MLSFIQKIWCRASKAQNRGFTLVELMVAMIIVTIIVGAVLIILLASTNFFETASSQVDLLNRAQIALNFVSNEFDAVFQYPDGHTTFDTTNGFYVFYTVTTKWDTASNDAIDWETRELFWSQADKILYWTNKKTGESQQLMKDVTGFEIKIFNSVTGAEIIVPPSIWPATPKYVFFLTVSKEIPLPNKIEWKTYVLKEERFLLKKP